MVGGKTFLVEIFPFAVFLACKRYPVTDPLAYTGILHLEFYAIGQFLFLFRPIFILPVDFGYGIFHGGIFFRKACVRDGRCIRVGELLTAHFVFHQ